MQREATIIICIDRRTFLKASLAGVVGSALPRDSAAAGETLYNGIVLPAVWPPRYRVASDMPVTPGYLQTPPAVINIDVGRQLFVDDFLIEDTSLTRTFHRAVYDRNNPVLKPEAEWEVRDEYAENSRTPPSPTAMVFSDGVFHDPADGLFKMWYMGGYRRNTCLVTSTDGRHWQRRPFEVQPGTNIVEGGGRDSGTVWLDQYAAAPEARFKMALFREKTLTLHASPDGIHWRRIGETGVAGDRTTFFYNPFRQVWVFGIRDNEFVNSGRYRRYFEDRRFEAASGWNPQSHIAWVKADPRDQPRHEMADVAELYNLDCVAYESVLLGLFNIWRGESPTREKVNEITVGFSRDGFHWDRPDRRSFLPVSDVQGTWNFSNVQSAGGCCLIVGDELYFYASGRSGVPGTDWSGTCSTGLATLRRDGFASLDWLPETGRARRVLSWARDVGALQTRPLRFSGAHLFVNADLGEGTLEAEVLDARGSVVPGLARRDCVPARGNSTRMPLRWREASLAKVANTPIRLRFWMTHGRLFAFWVSRASTGESGGYVAAGGPGFRSPVDSASV